MVRVRWGQAERYCGEVGGRSDVSAPDNDSPGVYTSGKVHDRCYRMRMLDQINVLVAVADGVRSWEYGFVGQQRGQD